MRKLRHENYCLKTTLHSLGCGWNLSKYSGGFDSCIFHQPWSLTDGAKIEDLGLLYLFCYLSFGQMGCDEWVITS